MNNIYQQINELINCYKILHKKLIENEKKMIDGTLVISKCNGKCRYYHQYYNKFNKRFEKKYINKKKINKARNLAQKSYQKKLIKNLSNLIPLLKSCNEIIKNLNINSIDSYRKYLINPITINHMHNINYWHNNISHTNPYQFDNTKIFTIKGEQVRSKSEKIFADLLFNKGINYKYEHSLKVGNSIYYPDFTLYSPYTFTEIYWEHFGMMDNPAYATNAIDKLYNYIKNGFIPGKNLIITFEYSNKVVDNKIIDKILKYYIE